MFLLFFILGCDKFKISYEPGGLPTSIVAKDYSKVVSYEKSKGEKFISKIITTEKSELIEDSYQRDGFISSLYKSTKVSKDVHTAFYMEPFAKALKFIKFYIKDNMFDKIELSINEHDEENKYIICGKSIKDNVIEYLDLENKTLFSLTYEDTDEVEDNDLKYIKATVKDKDKIIVVYYHAYQNSIDLKDVLNTKPLHTIIRLNEIGRKEKIKLNESTLLKYYSNKEELYQGKSLISTKNFNNSIEDITLTFVILDRQEFLSKIHTK